MAKRKPPFHRQNPPKTCVLIGLATRHQRREQLEEYLEELAFLAETAKADTQRVFIQKHGQTRREKPLWGRASCKKSKNSWRRRRST